MAAMAEKRQANLPAVFEHYKLPECTEGLFKAHCKHCNSQPKEDEQTPNVQGYLHSCKLLTTPQAPSVESLEEEISTYLSSPCEEVDINPLNFWKENSEKYQKLTPLVKRVLSVPSSSAAVERLFSTAGKVFTPERCRLNDSRFSKLMFIRCNNFLNYFQLPCRLFPIVLLCNIEINEDSE